MDEFIDDGIDELMDDGLQSDPLNIEDLNPSEEANSEELVIEDPNSGNSEQLEDEFISVFLKSRGIEDPTKIKFENDNGEIEEVDWNSLDIKDKLNIFNSSSDEEDLDPSEIELINTIRESLLTPDEYLQHLQRTSVETYLQNSQRQNLVYSIDQYSDEELYVMDLISKSEDITEEEALEALERAKSSESLFKKLVDAIRNEYRRAEEESILYTRLKQELEAQARFNLFAESIQYSILNFNEFSGCELNMNDEDMLDLYDFITGVDSAGNNWFNKALNDPETVVRMAWFVLNGEKMVLDINEYYQKEITNVRKESYNKGLKDASEKPGIIYKPKETKRNNITQTFDDLDEF